METKGIFSTNRSNNASASNSNANKNNHMIESNESNQSNNTIVISITENRAREICIAKIDSTNVDYEYTAILFIYMY